ncbi:GNAT family N-acetyltransferase [Bosea lathyri]|uniref:Acetyltransferase (GNAT) domain-containing protein n=1 Tax=Bosea lathyri TaxID=1036778 RepID=A0A1H5Z6Z2_9HYPH|nr:GNAT family N-acetyltransferase [Bosea lathyri]SEG31820.1 Acetyltransferase (GNAT) domain-containing protein [Bosea lathyri]
MNQIMALKGVPSGGFAPASLDLTRHRPDAPITIEIRPLAGCGDIAQVWSQLAARATEPNPFFEPGFALAAAQHLVAFRDVTVILAWQGQATEPNRRLVGLIPCFPRNRLFTPDALIGFADRRVLNGAPLLDARQAGAIIETVLAMRSDRMFEGRGLILRAMNLESPLVAEALRAAERLGLAATLRPAALPLLPDRPSASAISASRQNLARLGKLTLLEPTTQVGLRDAVEVLLAMEASGPRARAGSATLQDTREVGFLRAMTRSLAHVKQCRVSLLMLDDQPIAGAIVLGRARSGWLYLTAEDAAHAASTPTRVLLAMISQSAPSRQILQLEGLPGLGPAAARYGELHLTPRPARKPADIAARMRNAFRSSMFRPRHAAGGG